MLSNIYVIKKHGPESWRHKLWNQCVVDPTGKDWRTHKSCFLEQGYTIREIQELSDLRIRRLFINGCPAKSLTSIDNFCYFSRLLHTTIEDILVIDGDIPRFMGEF